MTEQERMDQLQQKLTALMKDESFVKRLMELETPEEIQSAFAAEGAEMTVEEIKVLGQLLSRSIEKNDELSEEDLEEVAGGDPFTLALVTLALVIVGTATGATAVKWIGVRKVGDWFRRW